MARFDQLTGALAARGVEAVAALPIFQAGHWWVFLICESRADDEAHFELVIDALKAAVSTLEAVMERSQAEANRMRSAHVQQSLLKLTRELLQQEVRPASIRRSSSAPSTPYPVPKPATSFFAVRIAAFVS